MLERSDIKAIRIRLGESQTEFARRFGVNQSTVHKWETKGLPNRGTARVAVESLLDELIVPEPAQ